MDPTWKVGFFFGSSTLEAGWYVKRVWQGPWPESWRFTVIISNIVGQRQMNSLSHPELLSLWCFPCRHCFVLSADSTVVGVAGEEDQDFLTKQIKVLYGSGTVRAVRESPCSPRSLSFSFAPNVVEVVSNHLSCKRSFSLGSPEVKTQECRLHNSFTCSWLQKLRCLRYTHLMGHLWSFIRAVERSLWFVFSHYTRDLTQALYHCNSLCWLYCAYLERMKRKYLKLLSSSSSFQPSWPL